MDGSHGTGVRTQFSGRVSVSLNGPHVIARFRWYGLVSDTSGDAEAARSAGMYADANVTADHHDPEIPVDLDFQ